MTPVIRTKPTDRVAVYMSTRNLYDRLPAAYNSLLAYTKLDHVYLLIEDDTFPYKLPANVTAVNVSGQDIFPHDGPNYVTRYSYMILLRAALTRLFPDLSRILSIDVDTIVHESLLPLWDHDLTGAYFAAVPEPVSHKVRGYPYPNFGVCIINLDYLRTTGMDDTVITELNTVQHLYPEQDAFVKHCGQFWNKLPSDYNDTSIGFKITAPTNHSIVTHYAGFKDWTRFPLVQYWLKHTTPPKRTVVYMGNRKYYPMLTTAAKSLLSHSPVDEIVFLTEDNTFPEPLPSIIRTVNVSGQQLFRPDGPNIHPYYSYMTLMRAALPIILPDEDRVLLLDPDTIVVDDISHIWATDLTYSYFAAVKETRNNDHVPPYYNAGVMLMNLAKMREDGLADRIVETINTVKYQHLEQDALNFLCKPFIFSLPSEYNASFVSDPTEHPRIMHFLAAAKKFLPEAQEPYATKNWNELPFVKGGTKHE